MFGFKKLCKDYDVSEQVGFAGTHGLWAIYNAVHKKTNTPATVWVMEKKPIEKLWFKKDQTSLKKLFDYMRMDAMAPSGAKTGLQLYERMEDDSSYYLYVTERVVGSLMSMWYQVGDLTLAKNASFSSTDPVEAAKTRPILKYTSPDAVLFGVTTALDDLSILHQAGVTHGNLTPANIVVTSQGEWRVCGFGFSENSVVQFEFSNDYSPFFRPSGAFMTPKQASSKCSTAQTDVAQLFTSIYAVFGGRPPHYDFFAELQKEKMPNGESLVVSVAEKLMGICQSGSAWSVSPQTAIQHANQTERFWVTFASKASSYYPLQYLGGLAGVIQIACKEQANGAQVSHQFIQNNPFCAMALEICSLEREGAFTGKVSTQLSTTVLNLLSSSLPKLVANKYITSDFIQISLLNRVIGLLSNKDYHKDLISLIISMNEILQIPPYELFLLFEPIVISHTMSTYRSMYPNASKSAPYQAFTGVTLSIGGMNQTNLKPETVTVKYTSPYNDIPLEKGMKEKDRERFCPVMDALLNEKGAGVIHSINQALYKNLLFFFSPKIGGRSHYYTLNFVIGCIACENDLVSGEVLGYLADSVILFTDKNWMMEETQLAANKVANAMSDIGSKFANLAQTQEEKEAAESSKKPQINYKQPITSVLTPAIGTIIKSSKNGAQIGNALVCLGKISNYFTDEQISRILLPQINDALDNIQTYAKAIKGFANFTKVIFRRCSARTVSSLFLPRLTRMCFVNELVGTELDEVRAVCDEIYQFFTEEVYKRVKETMPAERPVIGQTQAEYDPWGQQQQQTQQQAYQQPAAVQQTQQYSQQQTQNYGYDQSGYDYQQSYQQPAAQAPAAQTQNYDNWGQQGGWEQSQSQSQPSKPAGNGLLDW
ncbi:Kinase [Hexamita inflata]|uniref:Kinase n=1 Tax=Hexamita inflata TaxID=28002 RepID=A0AA86UBE7_9EUKA|nr:Kinase [Hexamita inflata]